VNCISECVLNVLNGNIALTGFDTRKLRKRKLPLLKLVDKQIPLRARNDLFSVDSFYRYWLLVCPRSLASLQPSNSHVMQVVPRPGRRLPPPPNAPIVAANDPKSCNPPQWIKLRTKHREAELRRNARTKAVADYMKQIIPAAAIPSSPSPPPTYSLNLMQSQDAGHRLM